MTKNGVQSHSFRQEKRAQRLTFWVRRPLGGVGVFHAKGWWPKSSCSPSKVCLPWVSTRGIPGILPGCPGPLGCSKSLCKKSSCAFFVPYSCDPDCPVQTPNRASGPKWEKMAEKWILAPRGKKGKNGRKMGKLAEKWVKNGNFPIFLSNNEITLDDDNDRRGEPKNPERE